MNKIKIVNDELAAKWKNKNIVFDYDGETFFYEGSEYYDYIEKMSTSIPQTLDCG